MKESAVNTDTQQVHYPFEIKIKVAEKLEQEKKIVLDVFPFWLWSLPPQEMTYTLDTRPTGLTVCQEAQKPTVLHQDRWRQHPRRSFLYRCHISLKKQKNKTYNSSPQNTQPSVCPYEGRTPCQPEHTEAECERYRYSCRVMLALSLLAQSTPGGKKDPEIRPQLLNRYPVSLAPDATSHLLTAHRDIHSLTAWLVRREKCKNHDGKAKRFQWICSVGVVAELNRKWNETSHNWGDLLDLAAAETVFSTTEWQQIS